MKQKVHKICEICGDKGNGRHFGAITCDSCKIFFKRNGNKNQEFIRNHEEREEKRQLVEENRRKRKQLNISQNSYPESNKSSNPSSMVSTISSDCGDSDSFFNDIIGCVLDVNERELREQIMEIENYVNNEDLDQNIETLSARQLLENINQKSRQMTVIPMFKELTDYNGLSGFTNICSDDQYTLFKYGCPEINVVARSHLLFQNSFAEYMNNFLPQWNRDRTILELNLL
ncbi:unnamed protein product [Oppiella nova]|uniref:Nuclear receptor domain-containing protein n=1 Tax=Oppiella nova TaxID=334625 RepID=A0A7R9LDT7_9ACAR|nr:unnamed protein product [Oppiella nova]CAG2162066.1 unnamed protein product [Oppiella nova]